MNNFVILILMLCTVLNLFLGILFWIMIPDVELVTSRIGITFCVFGLVFFGMFFRELRK